MGIHGLTTFLRENKRILSRPLTFTSGHGDGECIPLVVDGWSFIYKLLQDSNLPWVHGGEYGELARLVTEVVQAWLDVGLRPIFVFDGPTPVEKFQTVVARLNQTHIQPALLYFRTSAASRNSRRFLRETQVIPPLAYSACVQSLLSFRSRDTDENGIMEVDDIVAHGMLEVHFADEEGDPYAVELAGRTGGYVTGRDSDFVVLNSEGYKGYIPLDELVWLAVDDEADQSEDENPDGFQYVTTKKKRVPAPTAGQGIIPPTSGNLALSAVLYTPTALAQQLNLPLSLLPLLGALVGNDYTMHGRLLPQPSSTSTSSKFFQNLLFERRLNLSQRIVHVGTVLSSFIQPQPGKRKNKAPKSVLDLIEMTVGALSASSNAPASLTGPDQLKAIVESVIEGTLPYAMPARPLDDSLLRRTICALHYPEECRLLAILDRSDPDLPLHAADIVNRYLRAYRLGIFSPALMNILSSRTFWPRIFLENPDVESVSRSVSRPVRAFMYAILNDGIGIPGVEYDDEGEGRGLEPSGSEKNANGDVIDDEEDPDELVDVREDYSDEWDSEDDGADDVGKLRGALRDLRYDKTPNNEVETESVSEADSSMQASSIQQSSVHSPSPLPQRAVPKKAMNNKQKRVTEYVRKGAHIVAEDIPVPGLRKLLRTHHIDSKHHGNGHHYVPLQLQPEEARLKAVFDFLSVDSQILEKATRDDRLPLLSLHLVVRRLHERSREAENSKERQLERWTRTEARAFLASLAPSDAYTTTIAGPEPPTDISERAIQLTAQILTALESIELLAQVLLLTDSIPSYTRRFSGGRFHALLAASDTASLHVDDKVWNAVANGLDECFAEERVGKRAKKKDRKANAVVAPAMAPKISRSGSGGMYSLLADASA